MKVFINKESSVTIRDQLIEQIGLQIAAGVLKAEERLPSVRALAQRLGIHYNTVSSAYNHLSQAGLLEIRQGSGVRVVGKRQAETYQLNPDSLLRDFLAIVAEKGYSRQDIKRCADEALNTTPVVRILVVDRNSDFHLVPKTELQPHFDLPVETATIEELRESPSCLRESLVVTSLYHVFALRDIALDPTRLVVCNVEPGRSEQEAVLQLPNGSLVLMVSVSSTLLKMATNVIAALRGDEIALRSVLTQEKQELMYMLRFANLIICDEPSRESVQQLAGRTPLKVFGLYSQSTIELIKERLSKWG